MPTYIINGKQYTELDIKKRCAELMGLLPYEQHGDIRINVFDGDDYYYNPCINWNDAGPIIEKVWEDLIYIKSVETRWAWLMYNCDCTPLVAACICLIEMNEGD